MTQEEHLECSHQTSNPVSDQVNDDSETSKNISASNQDKSVVRSNTTSSGGLVSVDKALDLGDKDCERSGNNLSNGHRPGVKISSEVKISDKNNNNLEMTVITHQGSGENIREIQTKIENSEKILNNPDTVDDDRTENTPKDCVKLQEGVNVNKNEQKDEIVVDSRGIELSSNSSDNSEKNKIISKTSRNNSKDNDDPFARLRALKANISNVLKEVKAVLSEHGEPTNEPEEKEEIKPSEDNAIRFRFVRRIRKKSSFDEFSIINAESEKKEEPSGEIKEIPKIPEENLSTNNSTQKNSKDVEESLSTEPNHAKQTDPSPNVTNKLDSTHLPVKEEKVDTSSPKSINTTIIESIKIEPTINKNKDSIEEKNDLPDYQVKIIESKTIGETDKNTIKKAVAKSVENKNLTEEKQISSNNTDTQDNKNETPYRVRVIESVAESIKSDIALVENNSSSTENKGVSVDTSDQETIHEPQYKIKVVEVKSDSAEPKEIVNITSKTSVSKKSSVKESRENAEKPQGKVKTKPSGNQTKQVKQKVGAKLDSEKNDTSSEKPKGKKTKTEVEPLKKSKKINKEISTTEPLSSEKQKSSSTTKALKSKIKKELVALTEKNEQISAQDTKALVSVPPKVTVAVPPKTITLSPTKDLVPIPSKSEMLSKSDKSEPVTTQSIHPSPSKTQVLVPQKSVVPVESTKVSSITKKELIPIENRETTQVETISKQIPGEDMKKKELEQNRLKTEKTIENAEKINSIPKQLQNRSKNENVSSGEELPGLASVQSLSKQSQGLIESTPNVIKLTEVSGSIPLKTLPNTETIEKTSSDLHPVAAITDNSTKSKPGPTSALEKLLTTTNFKILPEVRPPLLPCEKPTSIDHVIVPVESQVPNTNAMNGAPTKVKKSKTEIQGLSSTSSILNDVTKLETISTSAPPNEKLALKPQTNNKTSNDNTQAAVEEKNNRDVDLTPLNKTENVNVPRDVEKAKPEGKPVDKVKLPLKIESNKIGTVVTRPTLTLLPSPTKADKLVSSKLELVPVPKPSQILTKDLRPKEDRAKIISQLNESQSIYDDGATQSHADIISSKQEEKQEEVLKEQEVTTCENNAVEQVEAHEETVQKTKKRKMKKKVVIKRLKRRLSTDGSVPGRQDSTESAEPEICEKEIKLNDPEPEQVPEPEPEEEKVPPGPKSCIKKREFQPGDIVLYNDRIKKVAKWKKATVMERITSISYRLDVEGDEKSCHICYIKKYTDKKVQFGAKEYLEIDYAQDEDDDEEEEYNIWARV